MLPAFDELYLEDAQREIGVLFHVACTARKDLAGIEDFARIFANSVIAKGIESQIPRYLGCISGIEYYQELVAPLGINYTYDEMKSQRYYMDDAYWCGSVLVYYYWSRGTSFSSILKPGVLTKLFHAYAPLHTMEFVPIEACKFLDKLLTFSSE